MAECGGGSEWYHDECMGLPKTRRYQVVMPYLQQPHSESFVTVIMIRPECYMTFI